MHQRVLCIAEKPSIAKAIANALGGGSVQSRTTSSRYIRNYEFAYNSPVWGPCEMTVSSVIGHLTDIQFMPPFDKWETEAVQLFSAPIKTVVTKEGQEAAKNIKAQSRKSSILYIWTDCDREGEHIGGEVADVAREANSRIKVFRAHFNNTEPSHIREAAGQPRQLDINQIEAVNVRRELDLRSGYSLTRLQTQLFRKEFRAELQTRAVQYGPCQFPTLGFVVDRYLRHKKHVAEPFWTIEGKIDTSDGQKSGTMSPVWDRGKIFDRMVALVFYERALAEGNGKFRVTQLDTKPTSRWRPLPLTTVSLQRKGAAALKMSSKQIMDIAERLYNEGYVSYPRTETDRFDKAIDLKGLVAKQTRSDAPWGNYARNLLSSENPKFRVPRVGTHDDKAHPPIHPVQGASRSAFSNDNNKWKVYEFITRYFLACCSDDAKGEATNINLTYAAEKFHLSGIRVLEQNFYEVYIYEFWSNKILPNWNVGDEIECKSLVLHESKTVAPDLLTEPELIGLMDANGIGTDATMAEHITKIQEREYVYKDKKGKFLPTPLGTALVLGYEKIDLSFSLTKPFFRRETEVKVSEVAEGKQRKAEVLGGLVAKYEAVFKQTQNRRKDLMNEARRHFIANDNNPIN